MIKHIAGYFESATTAIVVSTTGPKIVGVSSDHDHHV